MDFTSIFGLIIGLAAVVGGQMLEGGHPASLFQLTAFLIVGGGTMGAVMLQCTPRQFVHGVKMLPRVFLPPHNDLERQVRDLVGWSQIARKNGFLALEEISNTAPDPFLKKGLELLVDGRDSDQLRAALELDIHAYEAKERLAARVWESAGGYAPTLGILGAVLGLIHVMENLTVPAKLGSGIAVAFVATVYGVGLANLFFLPVGHKLKTQIAERVTLMDLQIEGLVGIAHGENPYILEKRLNGFLSPA